MEVDNIVNNFEREVTTTHVSCNLELPISRIQPVDSVSFQKVTLRWRETADFLPNKIAYRVKMICAAKHHYLN